MTQKTNLAQTVGDMLKKEGLSFCAAESCTGGLLLSTLTDVSGSSAYVLGGVVTYSNEAKEQLVNVQAETLLTYGAVSKQTAREMVIGVCNLFKADVGVSITGIAGPGGGTAEKPVGLVYVGVKMADNVLVREYNWQGNREENKDHSVVAALTLVQAMINQ
ncbi:MAG: hypothetical protein Phog2KO_40670 [Phototrophicaceae bacterium]